MEEEARLARQRRPQLALVAATPALPLLHLHLAWEVVVHLAAALLHHRLVHPLVLAQEALLPLAPSGLRPAPAAGVVPLRGASRRTSCEDAEGAAKPRACTTGKGEHFLFLYPSWKALQETPRLVAKRDV